MTTTTITASHKSHSLSALLHDAFHVRVRLSRSEDTPKVNNSRSQQRRNQSRDDQTTMLVTFAGRYGARY